MRAPGFYPCESSAAVSSAALRCQTSAPRSMAWPPIRIGMPTASAPAALALRTKSQDSRAEVTRSVSSWSR